MFQKIKWWIFTGLMIWGFGLQSQNLLEDYNPYFNASVNGWSHTGNTELFHVNNGAQTSGAARLQVLQTNGNLNNATLQSPVIEIPPNWKEQMMYLSLFVRSNAGQQTYRVRIIITNEDGSETIEQSPQLQTATTFQLSPIPFYLATAAQSFRIQIQCGTATGDYFFDDFDMRLASTNPASIHQFDEWQPRTFERPVLLQQNTLSDATPNIILTVDTDELLAPVMDTQFGVNSNFRSGNSLVERAPLYEGFGSFRFPAGSGSNLYFWDCNVPENFAIDVNDICGTMGNRLTPENFVQFKNNAQGEPTVVVNYFYARYGLTEEGTREARVQQAADYAAGLVHYLNVELNADIKYWEIGNECYGPWETGHDVNGSIVTGTEYGEDFRVFSETMKAVDPNILVGAVLSHKEFEWNRKVLPEVQDHADFLIVHHYFELSDAPTAAQALQEIDNDMQEIQAFAKYHTNKPAGYFPVAFTEFNIQGDQATTITNGLFVAEALLQMVKSRFSLNNIWVNEWNLNGFHSKGLLAQNDANQADYTARPTYTPFYFLDKCLGDQLIEVSASANENVRAYASRFSSGETGLLIVNYSDQPQQIGFDFTDTGLLADSIFWYSVHAENQQAGNMKFFVNGQTANTPGGGPANLDDVPANVATHASGRSLQVPKWSANYIVLNTQLNTNTGTIDPVHPFNVFPNPAQDRIYIEGIQDTTRLSVFDSAGREQTSQVGLHQKTQNLLEISIEKLSPGIYFFRLGSYTFKLLKP